MRRRIGRALAVGFVVANSVAVLYSNRPPAWSARWAEYAHAHWESAAVRAVDRAVFFLGWYPYLAGIDQRFTMFATVPRDQFVWRFFAVDRYGNRNELAGESDHKKIKLYLNLFQDEDGRRRYATYLCRRTPPRGGGHWDHLDWEWWVHPFVARDVAQRTGSQWQEPIRVWKTEAYPCPA